MKNKLVGKAETQDQEFSILESIYALPRIEYSENVDRDFLRYVRKRHYFLIIAAFDLKDRILIIRDFNKNVGWELLGGSISPAVLRDTYETAQSTARETVGTGLFDLQPISFVVNNFFHGGKKIVHRGIAFAGRVIGQVNVTQDVEWGFFKKLPTSMFTANKEIAELALQLIKRKKHRPAIDEVYASQAASRRHLLHKLLISKSIGRFASLQLGKEILHEIGERPESFLDSSCGDDEFAITLAKRARGTFTVCNDISVRHINYLRSKARSRSLTNIYFTNHDVLDLPFKKRFDVVLSKNTLHHFHSKNDAIKVIQSLLRSGRKLIIVDVEDPTRSSWLPWFWNKYYRLFLGDLGKRFITIQSLQDILDACCPRHVYTIRCIQTIRGKYLLATVALKKETGKTNVTY